MANLPSQPTGDVSHCFDWLIGIDPLQFWAWAEQYEAAIAPSLGTPTILLAERDPYRFIAGFWVAVHTRCPLVLGNPRWAEAEWQQVKAMVQPDWIWSHETLHRNHPPARVKAFPPHPGNWTPLPPGAIAIPTGGSSGQIKFALHTWDTLMASVQGFCQYFQCDRVHSFCVLPLHHVSGLMQLLRSYGSGGRLAVGSSKGLETGTPPDWHPADFFISLVPTQLQRMLRHPPSIAWLAACRTVLLGGAPPWADLLDQARSHRIPLALTYGMTETASHIAALKPEDFLNGLQHAGSILPHATVQICDPQGQPVPRSQLGQIVIRSRSLARAYYPPEVAIAVPRLWSTPAQFFSDDLGFLDEADQLHIVGRNSDKIITGGENVFPAEVEAAIRATGLVQDVGVVGVPDPDWGQAVTAVYVPVSPKDAETGAIDARVSDSTPAWIDQLTTQLTPHLSKFKHPKRWVPVSTLPRNAQGKVNRVRLQELAEGQSHGAHPMDLVD